MNLKIINKDERGLSKTVWLLIILILIAGTYVGIKLFGPYFRYWMMQDSVTEAVRHFAKVKPKNEDEVIQKVLDEARNQELPLEKENITYSESQGKLYMAAEWSEKVELPYYSHTFNFKAEHQEQIMR